MKKLDPRYFQIAVLATLLCYGVIILGFDSSLRQIALVLGSVLAFQYFFTRFFSLPKFDYRSALISGLSLCLLLRASSPWILVLGAFFTVASKFLIRVRHRHIFNPTNIGIVAVILLTGQAWVSPGQWGSFLVFAGFIASLGALVVNRASRSDVTLAFLIFYVGSLFARATWLGDPWSIPIHQLESGALLIFSFFMISDPKTTPETRLGRILFAALVATTGYYFRFKLFEPNALLYSLAICSPVVPLIDLLMRGEPYEWNRSNQSPLSKNLFPAT